MYVCIKILWYVQNLKTSSKSVYILKYFEILQKGTPNFDHVSSEKNTMIYEW